MKRTLGILALLSVGCAMKGAMDASGGEVDGDADSDSGPDAGAGDVDTDVDADADADTGTDQKDPTRESPFEAGAFDGMSECNDGVDNDEDGLDDCEEPTCMVSSFCCGGTGPSLSEAFDADTIDLGRWQPFGVPGPQVADGWLTPGGDHLFDSGVLGQDGFAPGLEIHMLANVEVPDACGEPCLQTIAVGLTDKESIGDSAGVDPVAAVVLSASGDAFLVVDGDVLGEESGVAAVADLYLTIGTDGSVYGRADSAEWWLEAGTVSFDVPLHAVAYGRSPDGAARLGGISLATVPCANPAGGLRQAAPVISPRVGEWDDLRIAAPSAAVLDGQIAVYYETQGGIGRALSDDGISFDRDPTDGPVVAGQASAPAVLVRTESVWLAVELPAAAGGARRIEVRESPGTLGLGFEGLVADLRPADEWFSFEDPALVDIAGEPYVYLTLVDDAGIASIGRIGLGDLEAPAPEPVEVVLRSAEVGEGAPDGVAAPEVRSGDALEMWFEERDGLETRIRYAASPDGLEFEVMEVVVLGPSRSGWDLLAVGDPAVAAPDGEILLYYAGAGGDAESIGLVQRVLPWAE